MVRFGEWNYLQRIIYSLHKQFRKHIQIRLLASNKALMGSGLLPDWIRKKHIYGIDTFDDSM